MRLWHKDLIPVLPRQQLLSQWRECCCIARNISVNGTPNHLLVNKVLDYPIEHFIAYSNMIAQEIRNRGYNCDWSRFSKWFNDRLPWDGLELKAEDVFDKWHNDRYLMQCYYNLQEKYDCGGISDTEFARVIEKIEVFL